jgi:hypothetical protein
MDGAVAKGIVTKSYLFYIAVAESLHSSDFVWPKEFATHPLLILRLIEARPFWAR